MRIIAGTKRGMRLFSPPVARPSPRLRSGQAWPCYHGLEARDTGSRPITDRVKQALFNILSHRYNLPDGKIVADLFCGVGSLGLEALSRGAEFVTFVEQDPNIIVTLKRNIEKAGFVKESKVIRANAFRITGSTGFQPVQTRPGWPCYYGLVFVDPPYAFTENVGAGSPLSGLLDLLQEQTAHDGLVVVRTSHRTTLSDRYGRFRVIERRRWGTMAVTILRKK